MTTPDPAAALPLVLPLAPAAAAPPPDAALPLEQIAQVAAALLLGTAGEALLRPWFPAGPGVDDVI